MVKSHLLLSFAAVLASCSIALTAEPAPNSPMAPAAYLNVVDFGAVGDGKADDTAALQLAIDSAGKVDEKGTKRSPKVYLPQGKYRITKTLNIGKDHLLGKLEGDGLITSPGGSAFTTILWDGAEGGDCFEIKGCITSLRISDLAVDGGGKARILLRINSIPGIGVGQFYTERVILQKAGTGIELGADMDMCASDMTFVDTTFMRMKTAGFRTMGGQNLNYVFIRCGAGYCPVGFHFHQGGSVNFTLPSFGWVDTAIKIENSGINNGAFVISSIWLENFGYTDDKKRMVILDASGEANVRIQSISTTCQNLWGDVPDLTTPNFLLGPSAQVTVQDCLISGKVAKLTGGKPADGVNSLATWIQFDNCRFRCTSDPRKDIECDANSGFELRNCNVMLDDTKAKTVEEYEKSMKPIMIRSYYRYPKVVGKNK